MLSNSHFENIYHKQDTRKLRKKVHCQSVIQSNYGGVLEMPQKVCGGDILHVMVKLFFLFSVRKLITCLIFEMPHFRINIGSNVSNVSKMGHFKNFELEKVGRFKN